MGGASEGGSELGWGRLLSSLSRLCSLSVSTVEQLTPHYLQLGSLSCTGVSGSTWSWLEARLNGEADTLWLQLGCSRRELLPAAFPIPKKETKSKQKYAQAFDESTVQYYYCIYLAALSSPYCSANTELSVAWWILRVSRSFPQHCSPKHGRSSAMLSEKCFIHGWVICLSPANQGKICVWREALFVHSRTGCLPKC